MPKNAGADLAGVIGTALITVAAYLDPVSIAKAFVVPSPLAATSPTLPGSEGLWNGGVLPILLGATILLGAAGLMVLSVWLRRYASRIGRKSEADAQDR